MLIARQCENKMKEINLRKTKLIQLEADILGEEWLQLIEKQDKTTEEQNLKDKLKRILIASGWKEDILNRLAVIYQFRINE